MPAVKINWNHTLAKLILGYPTTPATWRWADFIGVAQGVKGDPSLDQELADAVLHFDVPPVAEVWEALRDVATKYVPTK